MLYYIIAIILPFTYAALIWYIYNGWSEIDEISSSLSSKLTISIIIPAKDEADNIGNCIESILDNNYSMSDYEILVVNDHSNDNTAHICCQFSEVKLINSKEEFGKKNALKLGIQNAKNEIIITLDADCVVPKNWINNIALCFEKTKTDLVVGAVKIAKANATSFWNKLITQFEFFDAAAMMATTANGIFRKQYFLSNGANLAFKKSLFTELNGYEGNEHIASGDDVFLLNKAVRANKIIVYNKSIEGTVTTKPQETFSKLLHQRKRWATKTKSYANNNIISIQGLVFALSLYIVLALMTGPFWCMCFFYSGLVATAIKMLVDYFFLKKMSMYFNGTKSLFIPAFFFYLFMILFMGAHALLPSKYRWKGVEY